MANVLIKQTDDSQIVVWTCLRRLNVCVDMCNITKVNNIEQGSINGIYTVVSVCIQYDLYGVWFHRKYFGTNKYDMVW